MWKAAKGKRSVLGRPYGHLTEQLPDLFPAVEINEDAERLRAAILDKPWPEQRYVVFFTPRSGSSRLTDICTRSKVLAEPGEPFNPAFVPTIADRLKAQGRKEYVTFLLRHRSRRKTFGCEVTLRQMHNTLRGMAPLLELMQPTASFWLLREDIVAQAVSLSRMGQTKVSHSVKADEAAETRAEEVFEYRPEQIRTAVDALCFQEDLMEALFREHGLQPLRMSYETSVRRPEIDTLRDMARHVGVTLEDSVDAASSHRKLKGSKARAFTERFVEENVAFCAEISACRKDRLALIPRATPTP